MRTLRPEKSWCTPGHTAGERESPDLYSTSCCTQGPHSQLTPLTCKVSVLVMFPLRFGSIWLVMSRGIVQNFCWKPEWQYHLCSHTGLSSRCHPSVQTPTPLLQSPELEPRLTPCSLSSGQSYPGQMKCRWSSRDPQGVPGVTPGVPIPLLSAEPLQGLR